MLDKITQEILDKFLLELNKNYNLFKIKNKIIKPFTYQLYKQIE